MIKVKPKQWSRAVSFSTGKLLHVSPHEEYVVHGKFYDTEHHDHYFFIDINGVRAIVESQVMEEIDEEKV